VRTAKSQVLVFGFVILSGANILSDGSELLPEILDPGLIGGESLHQCAARCSMGAACQPALHGAASLLHLDVASAVAWAARQAHAMPAHASRHGMCTVPCLGFRV